MNGDKIYHGAVDNASGTAGLLEIAKAFTKVQPPPRRSVLFLSVTAEEKGLLGSQYYAEHPLYPLQQTLGEINMDGLNVWGRTKDIVVVGLGNSTLDDYVRAVAAEQGRIAEPDAEPEKGYYFRSDHFNFAKQGVPALDVNEGVDDIGRPDGWGMQMRDKFTELTQANVDKFCRKLSETGLQRLLDMAHALKLADDQWRAANPELSAKFPPDT